MARWKRRPDGSNWGDFGPDDQRGRLNLIGPEQVLKGVREVRDGRSFCLSLPLDYPGGNLLNPRRHPPVLRPTSRGKAANFNYALSSDDGELVDVISDDLVILHTQYSTQWDALSHVGQEFDADGDGVAERVYYNGFRAGEHVVDDGEAGSSARRLGIENMAVTGVQGRAVMIDLFAAFGRERKLVGYKDLMAVMTADGVTVEKGDMVCLHTGYAELVLEMERRPEPDKLHGACPVLDGRDPGILDWVSESGLAVLIADNYAVEAYPARAAEGRHASLPLHEHCLFKLGIHLGELWYLSALARYLRDRSRFRFLLTAPPLRLPGAVGSPVTPVATV
ncbi:cyclase family protein [Oceanibacterium hippocampi]|uniref:Putative cyclase n=1 Tax=Oceanibacterium hippocampi TaxID=745714 RepID=A0A1Y5S6J4_9PROT|nr:cyclase family protein [Oceanibacterium hippocampi]SLN32370.1 Putative cyclase [Oceanibacterium hippocampi]